MISHLILLLICAKSGNLSLGSCNLIVLIYENHLFSLMLAFENGRMATVSLGTFEVCLVLAHSTSTRRSGSRSASILLLLLLNHDVPLRFEMVSELSTSASRCLVTQELVRFLLVRLVAVVVVAREVRRQMS